MRKLLKNLLALGFGLLVAIAILEIFLRIWHPFPTRITHNDIVLPAGRQFKFHNSHIEKLDEHIVCSKNGLGFRGEEWPSKPADFLKIIVVGGSTTECRLLNDGHDWPNLLVPSLRSNLPEEKIWVNNAGLDGHSTFGHLILLENYLCGLQPDYVIYLTGINDVERNDLFADDQAIVRANSSAMKDWLKKNSETVQLANNLFRSWKAHQVDLAHGVLDLPNLPKAKTEQTNVDSLFAAHTPYLESYRHRLGRLVKQTSECGIRPVLITQPLLFGNAADPATGAELGQVKSRFFNGETYWCLLEKYNDVTRNLAMENNIPLIDLARWMPKDSRYFYDAMHFTNAGSVEVSRIVSEDLLKIVLSDEF